MLIIGHFSTFCKIQPQYKNSAKKGKFHGSARISMARGKLWALHIIIMLCYQLLDTTDYTASYCDKTQILLIFNITQIMKRYVNLLTTARQKLKDPVKQQIQNESSRRCKKKQKFTTLVMYHSSVLWQPTRCCRLKLQ